MTEIDRDVPVLVTGGSGYVASWIVKLLLDQGRTVHATTRDPKKAGHLTALAAGGPGTLKLFKADLLEPRSFDAAMQGCQLVIHTASPFLMTKVADPEMTLIRPAVEGTRNVLESANRTETVRRVVLTSSVVAVYGDSCDLTKVASGVFTEEHWNTTSSIGHNPYQYSKVAAEREAMRMQAAQSRWDLVAINPGMIFGPSLTRTTSSYSVETLVQLGAGKFRTGVPSLMLGCADVRDVAQAHVAAGSTKTAPGRYIVVAESLTLLQIAQILQKNYSSYPLPKKEVPKALLWLVGPFVAGISRKFVASNMGLPVSFDNSKSKQVLNLSYRPMEQTLTQHFAQVLDDGLVKRIGDAKKVDLQGSTRLGQ